MAPDELTEALRATPFEPFMVRMADGSTYRIPEPNYVAYPMKGRTAAVIDERGVIHIVDIRLMTELIFDVATTS